MKEHTVMLALAVFVALSSFGIFSLEEQSQSASISELTGFATTSTTQSSATISAYLSISASTNLSQGINFGTISTIPATNHNATANYAGGSSATQYNLQVSSDSNVAVDFCIKADSAFDTSGGSVIGLGNYSYTHNATANNLTMPHPGTSGTAITLAYVKTSASVAASGYSYYRFFLDVPAAQAAGTYNNTVSFKGIQAGGAC